MMTMMMMMNLILVMMIWQICKVLMLMLMPLMMIVMVMWQIGKVLAQLKEAGVENDTLVIMHSDDGWNLGEHGQVSA